MMAEAFAAQGWPAEVDETGTGLTAPFNAPGNRTAAVVRLALLRPIVFILLVPAGPAHPNGGKAGCDLAGVVLVRPLQFFVRHWRGSWCIRHSSLLSLANRAPASAVPACSHFSPLTFLGKRETAQSYRIDAKTAALVRCRRARTRSTRMVTDWWIWPTPGAAPIPTPSPKRPPEAPVPISSGHYSRPQASSHGRGRARGRGAALAAMIRQIHRIHDGDRQLEVPQDRHLAATLPMAPSGIGNSNSANDAGSATSAIPTRATDSCPMGLDRYFGFSTI